MFRRKESLSAGVLYPSKMHIPVNQSQFLEGKHVFRHPFFHFLYLYIKKKEKNAR